MSAAAVATAVRERPILFSGPMVRAILAGAKTQTRRVVAITAGPTRLAKLRGRYLTPLRDGVGLTWRPHGGAPEQPMPPGKVSEFCPYGAPGDRLWVRETWAAPHNCDHLKPRDIPPGSRIHYLADEERGGLLWRPSIFMPRWASRLLPEITEVRVQLLQEISDEDARAEGVRELTKGDPRCGFEMVWDSINGKRAPWASNPWVWAITFKRVA